MKTLLISLGSLASSVTFGAVGNWLAARDGTHVHGGLCIVLCGVGALVGGYMLREWRAGG